MDSGFAPMFLLTLAAVVVCRGGGYAIGLLLPDRAGLRESLDLVPACAIAAVLGPRLVDATPLALVAFSVGVMLFLWRREFVVPLVAGCAILLLPEAVALPGWLLTPLQP